METGHWNEKTKSLPSDMHGCYTNLDYHPDRFLAFLRYKVKRELDACVPQRREKIF